MTEINKCKVFFFQSNELLLRAFHLVNKSSKFRNNVRIVLLKSVWILAILIARFDDFYELLFCDKLRLSQKSAGI